MKKQNTKSSPTCKVYLEREAVLNAIDTALDDHTWSMGPEDDIEQIIKYVTAVPGIEIDLEDYNRVRKQLDVFRTVECDTCVHNGTGYDHMPCYACEDYNKYEWRGNFPVELCTDEIEKPDWQAKAEELQKTYEEKLVKVFDKIAKATKEHARGDACDWYFYKRLAEIRDEYLGGK